MFSADEARQMVERGEILALEAILQRNRTLLQGTILDIELEKEDERLFYEVKLLNPQGERWEHYFDARDSRPYKTERDE
ncbi:MAG: PepSY domain-containing protein [Gammaproteobacteria bacterium]|nr:PepSY domain-containing protein [Gammaproteobacteria bacterium]